MSPFSKGTTAVEDQSAGRSKATLMAHAAATRRRASIKLRAPGDATQPIAGGGESYKAHIIGALGRGGIPASIGDVHNAIGTLTQLGHFDPQQGAALLQHNGPLAGPEGLSTAAAIGHMIALHKRSGQPRLPTGGMGAPQGGGGLPQGAIAQPPGAI